MVSVATYSERVRAPTYSLVPRPHPLRFLFFCLMHLILNYECKCVYVHNNLVLKSSTLFIVTTSIRREFHILMTDGKNE